jgi:Rrf2 family nitric oxide-sensitive transcriptional repressor
MPTDKKATIEIISNAYEISPNNVNKIVHQLALAKIIETKRGKGGGFKLALAPKEINIGDIVVLMESTLMIIDCDKQHCKILPVCELKIAFHKAAKAFIDVLKQYTLADLVQVEQPMLIQLLKIES